MCAAAFASTTSLAAVPEDPSLSPDGRQIAYALRTIDLEEDREIRRLWLVSVDGDEPQPITDGPDDRAAAWSPDGTTIAFLSSEGDGPAQVWLLPLGGSPVKLTTLQLGAGAPQWSPDGNRIAFVATVDLRAADGEDEAARRQRMHAPLVADRLDYQADGEGFRFAERRHVHVVDAPRRSACASPTDTGTRAPPLGRPTARGWHFALRWMPTPTSPAGAPHM